MALPALRERDDLEALMDALLQEVAPASPAPRLSPAARRALMAHSWPGNVRELQQALRLGAVLAEDGWIEPEHLPAVPGTAATHRPPRRPGHPGRPDPAGNAGGVKRQRWQRLRRRPFPGDRAGHLYRKMRRFGLERPGLQNR